MQANGVYSLLFERPPLRNDISGVEKSPTPLTKSLLRTSERIKIPAVADLGKAFQNPDEGSGIISGRGREIRRGSNLTITAGS